MESRISLFLLGAAIALVSSGVTALIQHALWLRRDRVRRERDREEQRAVAMRTALKSRLEDTDEGETVPAAHWSSRSPIDRGLDALFSHTSPPQREEDVKGEASDASEEDSSSSL